MFLWSFDQYVQCTVLCIFMEYRYIYYVCHSVQCKHCQLSYVRIYLHAWLLIYYVLYAIYIIMITVVNTYCISGNLKLIITYIHNYSNVTLCIYLHAIEWQVGPGLKMITQHRQELMSRCATCLHSVDVSLQVGYYTSMHCSVMVHAHKIAPSEEYTKTCKDKWYPLVSQKHCKYTFLLTVGWLLSALQ